MKAHTESYIDKTVEITESVPSNVAAILETLEEYDKKNPVCYFDRLDDLWVIAKNCMAAKVMSKKCWEQVQQKYWFHAEDVMSKEG